MEVLGEPRQAGAAQDDRGAAPRTHITPADFDHQDPQNAHTTNEVFGFADLLASEEVWIESRAQMRRIKGVSQHNARKVPARQIGLAISVGGVRSATYGLGVLQALAKPMQHGHSLLEQLGYISSVSGGSYIDSWLTAWMRWAGFNAVAAALAEAKLPESVSAKTNQSAEMSSSAAAGDAATASEHTDPTAHVARVQNVLLPFLSHERRIRANLYPT